METFINDARYAVRMVTKSPGFSIVIILLLALGIGANTAIFGVINALLLRPPDVDHAAQLVDVFEHDKTRGNGLDAFNPLTYPDYLYFRDHNSVFSGFTASGSPDLSVVWSRNSQGEAIHGQLVAANFFSVLSVKPELGRIFLPDEDGDAGTAPVVMVSHAFWQERLGADQRVVSRQIVLNGSSFTIVGVIPASFHGVTVGITPDVWAPINTYKTVYPSLDIESRNSYWLMATGRLKPGMTPDRAGAEMRVLSQQLASAYPDSNKTKDALVYSTSMIPGPYRGFVALIGTALLAVVSLVLVMACANAANMLLARASGRRREMAIRSALGASRWRLVRQTLAESVLLAGLGGIAGLALAGAVVPLLMRLKPASLPVSLDAPVDFRVMAFALAAAMLTGIAFGLAPALHSSRLDLVSQLKGGTPGGGRVKSRLRNTLVVAQVTVCLVLLIGAGLCLRSLANAQSIDPGFDLKNGLIASLNVQTFGYNQARGRVLYRNLLERAAALPGVQAVSLATPMPLGTSHRVEGFAIEGSAVQPSRPAGLPEVRVDTANAAPGYFRAMGIPILAGRDFSDLDTASSPHVVIINEAMAKRYWPGQNPIGRHLIQGDASDAKSRMLFEVVGVTKTGKYRTIGEDSLPFLYHPFWQNYAPSVSLIVRVEGDTGGVVAEMRDALRGLDPNLAIFDVQTVAQWMQLPMFPARATGLLLGVFGGLALLIASAGLYGVMAYVVSQRVREVGIRMALGASAQDVVRMIVLQGMRLTLAGVALGLAGAFAVTRLLRSLLYGVRPTDFATFAGVSLLLAGVALLASYIPARRAAKVDPIVALRYE